MVENRFASVLASAVVIPTVTGLVSAWLVDDSLPVLLGFGGAFMGIVGVEIWTETTRWLEEDLSRTCRVKN